MLNRTVVVDSDRHFNNLCSSHLDSGVTVNNNSPTEDYVYPDDQTQPTYR